MSSRRLLSARLLFNAKENLLALISIGQCRFPLGRFNFSDSKRKRVWWFPLNESFPLNHKLLSILIIIFGVQKRPNYNLSLMFLIRNKQVHMYCCSHFAQQNELSPNYSRYIVLDAFVTIVMNCKSVIFRFWVFGDLPFFALHICFENPSANFLFR